MKQIQKIKYFPKKKSNGERWLIVCCGGGVVSGNENLRRKHIFSPNGIGFQQHETIFFFYYSSNQTNSQHLIAGRKICIFFFFFFFSKHKIPTLICQITFPVVLREILFFLSLYFSSFFCYFV